MAAEWYCELDGKQLGPMTPYELKDLATSGRLQASHLIWKEGLQRKVPARSVRGLFDDPPGGTATATKPPPAPAPLAPVPAVETPSKPSAEATTTAEAPVETPTWVEKTAPVPKPAPRPEDDVVETQVAEDVVETEAAEDVVETAAADEPVVPVEPVLPSPAPAEVKKKTTNRDRLRDSDKDRETERSRARRDEDEERDRIRDRDHTRSRRDPDEPASVAVNLTAVPPSAGKPFRVLSAGQVRGPYALEELRRMLADGKLSPGDLIGVETWLPVATLSGLPLENVARESLGRLQSAPLTPMRALAAAKTRVANGPAPKTRMAEVEPDDIDEVPAEAVDTEDDIVEAGVEPVKDEEPDAAPPAVSASPPAPKKEPEKKEAPKTDGDSIPVDEEFKF